MFGGSYETTPQFEALPEGRYVCALENCVIDQSKSGTNYLNMTFIVQGGEHDGRKVWHKLWFTEKAYNMTAQQLDNIYVFKRLPQSPTIEAFMNAAANSVFALLEKRFEIEVQGHDEYNGKLYPKTFLTHYMDTPNMAVQLFESPAAQTAQAQAAAPVAPARMATQAPRQPRPIGPAPMDANEEIPF